MGMHERLNDRNSFNLMFSFGFTSFVKLLFGIVLLQAGTVLIVYTALETNLEQTWPLFGALGLTLGALSAFWFNSIAASSRKQTLAKAKEGFLREREKIRVRAEREKTKEAKTVQRQIHRERQKAKSGSNLKTGVIIGGAVAIGAIMLLTQMVTLGLLTLTTAGGAALGYGVRARQDRLGQGRKGLLGHREEEIKVIDVSPSVKAVEGPSGRGKSPDD